MNRSELLRLDKSRVWHPWTMMQQYIEGTDPFVIERAQGSRIYDADGRSYIDAISSWWVATLGHGHPRLVRVLAQQAEKLAHVPLAGATHEPAVTLAEMLCRSAPRGLERVFYSDNGSTAVEVALKLAHQFWRNEGRPQKSRFLSLAHAFHGETLGAASLSDIDIFKRAHAALMMDCLHAPVPSDAIGSAAASAALERILEEHGETICALVIEPRVQGGAGMHIYPADFLRRARAACDRADVLLIADEVFTGYGRTGTMWASDSADVAPDIMCLSKGFTGGMLPMSATLTTERVFRAFFGGLDRAFLHGHSFCGNPLGAAVAAEVLRIFKDEEILQRAKPKAERIAATIGRLGKIAGVERPRALGMIGAIDLSKDASYGGTTGWRVAAAAKEKGVFLRPMGDVVYVCPPLTIPSEELEQLLDVLEESVASAWGAGR